MSEIELPEPAAWLVTGGRTYHDKAFVSKDVAETSISERRDGARLDGLFTAEQVRAAILAERERCIRIAEGDYEHLTVGIDPHASVGRMIAAAIRRGSV